MFDEVFKEFGQLPNKSASSIELRSPEPPPLPAAEHAAGLFLKKSAPPQVAMGHRSVTA